LLNSNELWSQELTEAAQIEVAKAVDELITAYDSKEQQELAQTRFSMPLNQIMKQPETERFRKISASNSLMKPVCQGKSEIVDKFLSSIGFSKQSDGLFIY